MKELNIIREFLEKEPKDGKDDKPDYNPDPNHWYDTERFKKELDKVVYKTVNPYWYQLQTKTMMTALLSHLGDIGSIKLIWSGNVPFEVIKWFQTRIMKRIPDGTYDGRVNPKYKVTTSKNIKEVE